MSKTKVKTKTKVGKQKVEIDGQKLTITHMEDVFQLDRIIQFDYNGKNIGALLLKKEENYKLVFGFKCEGVNNVLPLAKVDNVYNPLENGLKDFPEDESLTIHQKIVVDGSKRIEELQRVREQASSLELKFLLMSEEKSIMELSNNAVRKEIDLSLYASYTFTKEGKKSKDPIENYLKTIEKMWHSFSGEKEEIENQNIKNLLEEGYSQGWERWLNFLNSKLALDVETYTSQELWQKVCSRFTKQDIPVPQILHIDEEGLSVEINSTLDPISRIFTHQDVPIAKGNYTVNDGKFVATLSLLDKPESWKDARTQLQQLWRIIARQEIYDTEIVAQLTKGNVRLMRDNMARVAKQAQTDGEIATKSNSNNVDISAKLRNEKALKAQEALYSDDIPFKIATVFLVHRDDLKELESACSFLQAQFQSPLELFRESTYAHTVWLQTIPLSWTKILTKPYERRQDYLNTEIVSMLPLVQPQSPDRQGLEFLSAEGNIPVYLDLWKIQKHMLLLATNRAGKGILLARIVIHNLARNIPVSIMDFPRPDGTSTFSYLAEFLGDDAEYFNTRSSKFNIFEIPDLSRLDKEQQKERFTDFKEFLIDILETMVVGTKTRDGVNPDTIRALLILAIDQFYSPDNLLIHNRFTAAFQAGRGTPEWEQSPTLKDFVGSLGAERLNLINPTPDMLKHLEIIKVRLKYWLSSRIGQAISAPSTMNPDAKLIVYAMANLDNEEDAAIMCLTINMQILRKSMSHPKSMIIVDEVSILVRFEAIAKNISRFCANGLKSGIQMLLSGQDVDSIVQSNYGSQILQNTPVKMVGKIEPMAVNSMIGAFALEKELIDQNATKAYKPDRMRLSTKWLINNDGTTSLVDFCADEIQLGVVANNMHEVLLRKEILAQHENKYLALAEFSKLNADKIKGQ
jgi:hypothetical protein